MYNIREAGEFKIQRIVGEEESPGCEYCIAISKIKFNGRLTSSGKLPPMEEEEEAESIRYDAEN
jgi:hypothetical protein